MSSLLEIEAMLDAKMAQLRSEQRLLESEIAECHRDKSNKRSIEPLSINNNAHYEYNARHKRSLEGSNLNVHHKTKWQSRNAQLSTKTEKEELLEEELKNEKEKDEEEYALSEEDGNRRKMTLKERLQELEAMRKKYATRANKSMNDYLRNVSNYESYQEERSNKLANAKPFSFEMREKAKPLRICEVREQNETEERRKAEAEACQTVFTAKPVPPTTFMNKYDLMVEEWAERKAAIESLARAKADIMKEEEAELAHSNAILKQAREEIRGSHSYYDNKPIRMANNRECNQQERLLTRAQSADGRFVHKRNDNLSSNASYATQQRTSNNKSVNNHNSNMMIDASIPLEVRLRLWPALNEYENVRQERLKAKAAQMKTNVDTEFSQSMPLMNSVAECKNNNNSFYSTFTHRLPNFMIDYKTFLSTEDNVNLNKNANTTLSGHDASHPILGIGQPISVVTAPPAPLSFHTTSSTHNIAENKFSSSSPSSLVVPPHNTHITAPLPPPTQVALAPFSSPLTYSPRSSNSNNNNPLTSDNKVYGIGATISTTAVPSTITTTSESKQTSLLPPPPPPPPTTTTTAINTNEGTTNVTSENHVLKPTSSVSEKRRIMRRSNSAFSFHPRIRPGIPNFKELWAQEEATRQARKAAIMEKLQQTSSTSQKLGSAALQPNKQKQEEKEKKKEVKRKKIREKKYTSDLTESTSATPMTSDINKIPKGTRAHALRTQAVYTNYLHSTHLNPEKEESNTNKEEGGEMDEKRKAHQREVRNRLRNYLESTKTSQREQEERIAMKVKELKSRERESAQAARKRLKEMYERVNQMPPLFVAEPITRLHAHDSEQEQQTEPSARDAAEQEVIALLTESGLQQEHLQQLLASPAEVTAKDIAFRAEEDNNNTSNVSVPGDSAVQLALRVVNEALYEIQYRQDQSKTNNNNNRSCNVDDNTAVNLTRSAEEKSKVVVEGELLKDAKDANAVVSNNETVTDTKKKERSLSSSSTSSSSTTSSSSSSSSVQLHPLNREQLKTNIEDKENVNKNNTNDNDHDNVDKHSEYDDSFESSSSSSSSST